VVEARKTVTVVFADVSGSTALGERLDPEAFRRVMERYFSEARTALECHGGTVEKFIGDAVMAVFGIPAAHEDDALRAVRAARDMQEALARLNADLQRERGVTLGVRTGINTGEAVVGDPSGGQFYATGDAVNVAARLEQAASADEILLGEETYRLVRDAVDAEAVGELALRGKAEALAAYRLLDVVELAPAVSRRLDTPFVGRRSELARLIESLDRAVASHEPTLVTVLGPAGIGKTRLAGELVAAVGERATVLQGRCLSYGEGITFWPLEEILRSLAERPAGAPIRSRPRAQRRSSGLTASSSTRSLGSGLCCSCSKTSIGRSPPCLISSSTSSSGPLTPRCSSSAWPARSSSTGVQAGPASASSSILWAEKRPTPF
jgi:class 3 adenylate cyclase